MPVASASTVIKVFLKVPYAYSIGTNSLGRCGPVIFTVLDSHRPASTRACQSGITRRPKPGKGQGCQWARELVFFLGLQQAVICAVRHPCVAARSGQ